MIDAIFICRKIYEQKHKALTQLFYKPFFNHIGKRARIIKPLKIRNANSIYIGDNVTINDYAFIMVTEGIKDKNPKLFIGDNSDIGHYNHIICSNGISIGKNVMTADKVLITDNNHCFTDIETPISKQGIMSKRKTIIGDGSWIGENCCVISATIGKNCVIGANSVVISDIPDYSIAVGNPARVVKHYDFDEKSWKRDLLV